MVEEERTCGCKNEDESGNEKSHDKGSDYEESRGQRQEWKMSIGRESNKVVSAPTNMLVELNSR